VLARPRLATLSPAAQRRLLEILPGALTWLVLLAPVVAAFAIRLNDPTKLWVLGVAAILLDCYWFARTTLTVRSVRRSLRRIQETESLDWWARCCEMEIPEGAPGPSEIVHCALIPTYTESYDVLRGTVAALAEQNYPERQRVVAIITRVTDTGGWENVARLREEFGDRFLAFLHIKDPLLPGIVVGKSAAMSYGGPELRRACDELGLDPSRTLVTDLDSDFRLHPQYWAYITAQFCSVPDRLTSIWQPVPLFTNNLWKVPAAVRVMATAATQWQMFLHDNPHRLVMFSSYTMPMRLLSEVGYWDSDVIPEDSRFFWKSFFHYGERLNVRPAFLTVCGDAPRARDYASTHVSQYNQIKRWAWGITDVPYVMARFFKHPEIPFWLRFRRFMNLFLNHLNWIFLPVLLLFGASVPIWVSVDFSLTDMGQLLWSTSGLLLAITLSTVVFFIYFEMLLLPPKPADWPRWKRLAIYGQYFLYPMVGLVLSVLPALEAHTRLLFGRYLEYRVTEKV
jgi:hypothetical protein